MKQSLWLNIVHSGDRCLRLALHTPSGAWHNDDDGDQYVQHRSQLGLG